MAETHRERFHKDEAEKLNRQREQAKKDQELADLQREKAQLEAKAQAEEQAKKDKALADLQDEVRRLREAQSKPAAQ